jgi:hypothetical protein
MNWKGYGRKQSYSFQHLPGGTEENNPVVRLKFEPANSKIQSRSTIPHGYDV